VSVPTLADSRVLVTGASGFIGARLLERLQGERVELHAVSRRPQSGAGPVRWHESDLVEPDAVRRLVENTRPDVVFHLAGDTRAARNLDLVSSTFQANLVSTVNLLTAVAEHGRARVVLTGSMEEPEHGEPPSSPYAASKLAARSYGELFAAMLELPVIVLRLFMTFGPGQQDLRKLVPYVTLSLLRGVAPQLTSGQREVDWVYIDDVAAAFVAAGACSDVAGASVDVGSGTSCSIRSLVERLVELVDPTIAPVFGAVEDRPLEQVRTADVEAAAAAIGWQPRVSLDEGLERTVGWYRDNLARLSLD
jgi:UDP-glucose 4-epimerase